ncbi:MAG: SUMF1/EgtB/PvdO family nonheme iron enzyme [Kiritimatiellae bacterium]|nr:SUMF1/EgtB/PvdO family nonheme iron enzyme [Kiritimatiellia bacterium]MDD4735294.1 SUMF1/EgtB/PvdO family nonheme iron enzyme [Kiritimatiellia bacterium]
MSKPTPKKNALASAPDATYNQIMETIHSFLCFLLSLMLAGLVSSCAPPEPEVQHRMLPPGRMNRIPRGHLKVRVNAGSHRSTTIRVAAFYLSEHEITRSAFAEFMQETRYAATPALIKAGLPAEPSGTLSRPHHPVTGVTLHDARAYCRWLSRKTCEEIRLPTETEWEYAARAGVRGAPFSWGWGDPAGRAAWNTACAEPVGKFAPNAFGLYDMSGNVYEWCEPSPDTPAHRTVIRGGAWSERDPDRLRVDSITEVTPDYCSADTGFRITMHPRETAD